MGFIGSALSSPWAANPTMAGATDWQNGLTGSGDVSNPLIGGASGLVNSASGGMFNTNANFSAQGFPIQNPVSTADSQGAMGAANDSLNSQQSLVAALAAQNGIGNQSQVMSQLQGLANGTGPSLAQSQLNQATGANVANQAALMAGQRGAGSNVGMMARQAGQQGAATQQQAAGQMSSLRAQEQLGAIGAAGQMANQQVGQQMSGQQALTNNRMQQQQNLMGAQAQFQGQQLQNVQQQNQYNAAIAQSNQQAKTALVGGLMKGAGAAAGAMAEGGEIESEDSMPTIQMGGDEEESKPGSNISLEPQTVHDKFLFGLKGSTPRTGDTMMAHGGVARKTVPALVSPGEKIIPPAKAKAVKEGKASPLDAPTVPGKPRVDGSANCYANDTVPRRLPVGSIVLPRSVTQSDDPAAAATKFIAALKAKKGI